MMGPAGRSLAEGPEAVAGNPACIGPGFAAGGGRWNLQTSGVSAAAGFSLSSELSAAAGVTYLGRGGLIRRDETGAVSGEYSYGTGSALAGFSYSVAPWLRAGVSMGVAWENIDAGSGTGMVLAGGLSAKSGSWSAGAGITGIGSAPSWNGIKKDMPTEVHAGGEYLFSDNVSLFAGSSMGFSTASSFGGGLKLSVSDLALAAGYTISPGEEEISGVFGGLSYIYQSGGTYIVQIALAQRHELEWPVMAGIAISF